MAGYGYIVIETPVGEGIYVDGVLVGTVSAPVTEEGTFRIDSVPGGAKIYLKKTAGYVYHGITPQTLTLPASPIPYILRLEKAEFDETYGLIYIPPGETVSKTYHLERVVTEEPEVGKEPTATVNVRSSPPGELWMYMEGAEGFVSYGTTPKTLTLKATRGMWVAMEEAKTARAEGRVTDIEATRLDDEIARRAEILRLAKEAYNEAKASRKEADDLLRTFRELYNNFLVMYNAAEDKTELNKDLTYWSDMLKYYEERVQVLREFEEQMKDEYDEAKTNVKAPYWMVTPGLLGTTWRLKITKKDYAEVVDKFILMPGTTYTKDYALVKALDLTTPESLAPFIEDTPPPMVPDMPYAHAWLYIVCWDPGVTINAVWYGGANPPIKAGKGFLEWHKKHHQEIGMIVCGNPIAVRENCKGKFLKVPPGKNKFYVSGFKYAYGHWMNRQTILKYTLTLAPGETRYITYEYTTEGITTAPGICPWSGVGGMKEPAVFAVTGQPERR